MARYGRLLTDAQGEKILPLLPKLRKHRRGGRPWTDSRKVLEGILWILRSGARWQDLPEEFPSPTTCWRRLRDWEEQGVWLKIWQTFLAELNERQQLKWSESFLDGSFAPAKKGARESEKPSGARGRSGCIAPSDRVGSPPAAGPRFRPACAPALPAPAWLRESVGSASPAAPTPPAVPRPAGPAHNGHPLRHRRLRLAPATAAPPLAAASPSPSSVRNSSPCVGSRGPSHCCHPTPPAPASSFPSPT